MKLLALQKEVQWTGLFPKKLAKQTLSHAVSPEWCPYAFFFSFYAYFLASLHPAFKMTENETGKELITWTAVHEKWLNPGLLD